MHRQYSPEEVSAILREAAEETRKHARSGRSEGLTLAELQSIGADSDIDAAAIQRAAARIDARTLEPAKRRVLGVNVGASHAVRLLRPMTDAEFDALVSDCRRLFDAKGKVTAQPNFREWRNGNLRIWTDEDPHTGESLLLMQSTQGAMRSMIVGGAVVMLWALVSAVMSFFETGGDALAVAVTLAFASLGLIGAAALATWSWSNTREEQMEELGERALDRQADSLDIRAAPTSLSSAASSAKAVVKAPEESGAAGGGNHKEPLLDDVEAAGDLQADGPTGRPRERTSNR